MENPTSDAVPKPPNKFFTVQNIIIIIFALIILIISFLFFQSKWKISNRESAVPNSPSPTVNLSESAANNPATADQTAEETPPASDDTAVVPLDNPTPTDTGLTPPPTVTKADLYVKKYTFNHDPVSGEEFEVRIDIGNKGGTDAEDFYWEWWPTSSGKACREKISKISAGSVESVSCDYTYNNANENSTKVIVDSDDDIDESNENNNIATKKVTAQLILLHPIALPDLYVSDYHFTHDPVMGEPFTVHIVFKNKGNASAGLFKWEWWAASAVQPCGSSINGLDAGDSFTVTCTYTYPGWSTYTTKAIVDSTNLVVESDEGNNVYTKTVIPIH